MVEKPCPTVSRIIWMAPYSFCRQFFYVIVFTNQRRLSVFASHFDDVKVVQGKNQLQLLLWQFLSHTIPVTNDCCDVQCLWQTDIVAKIRTCDFHMRNITVKMVTSLFKKLLFENGWDVLPGKPSDKIVTIRCSTWTCFFIISTIWGLLGKRCWAWSDSSGYPLNFSFVLDSFSILQNNILHSPFIFYDDHNSKSN